MMSKYVKGHELKDEKIIEDIKAALADYEDGAIIECAAKLDEITEAIWDWDKKENG